MIPAAFDYEVAESAEHAVALLGESEDAKLLAGGHSLLPAMRIRLARPSALIDIGRVSELSYVKEDSEHIAIGALTRHQDVRDNVLLQAQCPIVSYAAGLIGDPQVRHRGTIGGSLAHGDPASDLPAVILALDAELVVRGAGGERAIPASAFFTDRKIVVLLRVGFGGGGCGASSSSGNSIASSPSGSRSNFTARNDASSASSMSGSQDVPASAIELSAMRSALA